MWKGKRTGLARTMITILGSDLGRITNQNLSVSWTSCCLKCLLTFHRNETEDFRRHRRWPSAPNELEFDEQDVNDDDNTFRLEIPAEAESPGSHSTNTTNAGNTGQDPGEDEEQDENTLSAVSNFPQQKKRPLIPMEATTTRKPRRKNIKLTRHGVAIPA